MATDERTADDAGPSLPVARLAFRQPDADADQLAVPLFPPAPTTGASPPVRHPLLRAFDEAETDSTEAFLDGCIASLTTTLAARFEPAPSRTQIDVLSTLVGLAGGDLNRNAIAGAYQRFVWSDCATATVLALFDELACMRLAQPVDAGIWAKSAEVNLDRARFARATGLDDKSDPPLDAVIAEGAIALDALLRHDTQVCGAGQDGERGRLVGYRDRWFRLSCIDDAGDGGDAPIMVEPLTPLAVVGPADPATGIVALVPLVPVEVYATGDRELELEWRTYRGALSTFLPLLATLGPDALSMASGAMELPLAGIPDNVEGAGIAWLNRDGYRLLVRLPDDHLARKLAAVAPEPDPYASEVAQFEPHVVTYYTDDRPGSLLRLATRFAKEGINVAAMTDASFAGRCIFAFLLEVPSGTGIDPSVLEDTLAAGADATFGDRFHHARYGADATPPPQSPSDDLWTLRMTCRPAAGVMGALADIVASSGVTVRRCTAGINGDGRFELFAVVQLRWGTDLALLRKHVRAAMPDDGSSDVAFAACTDLLASWLAVPEVTPTRPGAPVLAITNLASSSAYLASVTATLDRYGLAATGGSISALGDVAVCLFDVHALDRAADASLHDVLRGDVVPDLNGVVISAQVLDTPAAAPSPAPAVRHEVQLDGRDRPGMALRVLRAVHERDCNIERFYMAMRPGLSTRHATVRFTFTGPAGPAGDLPDWLLHAAVEDQLIASAVR